MATFFQRAEELRSLFGWEPADLYNAIGLDKSTYSRWKTGAAANRDALIEMSRRFLVSIDSLMALEGTSRLEPSPVLRRAHMQLLESVLQIEPLPETPAQRLALAYQLVQIAVPGLTVETWAAYLRTTVGGWLEIQHGYKEPTDDHLAGASHLLGWYELRDAWLHWLVIGSVDRLRGPSDETVARLVKRMTMMGGVPSDVADAIERRITNRTGWGPTENK